MMLNYGKLYPNTRCRAPSTFIATITITLVTSDDVFIISSILKIIDICVIAYIVEETGILDVYRIFLTQIWNRSIYIDTSRVEISI